MGKVRNLVGTAFLVDSVPCERKKTGAGKGPGGYSGGI